MSRSNPPAESLVEPRATRIQLPHRSEIRTEIWMGGTESLLGHALAPADAVGAVIVDCCGDLPHPYRESAARYVPQVFMDAEVTPFAYPRLTQLVHELAASILGSGPDRAAALPERILILCQYGMNRSGLVTGLLLRALGEAPEQTVALIRRLRPGSLSNETFASLIEGWNSSANGRS